MTVPRYTTIDWRDGTVFEVSNAAGDSFAGEFTPGLRLRADCGPDGVRYGAVASAVHDAVTGKTAVTATMDGGQELTDNLAGMLHGFDGPDSLCNHAGQHAAGARDALAPASIGAASTVALAAVHQSLLDEQATLDDAVDALETAVNLRALTSWTINTTFPIQGGGDASANRTFNLVYAVVSELLGYGVTLSGKVVTDQILKAATKLLISANTTIYVATTGSDTTGTGLAGAPFASIHKALASIAGMLIASGVTVTIRVADGTYAVNASIVVDHPDADKILILGNTSAETTVAISSIDTTAKTITVAGNYVSNADATKNIQAGDMIGLAGSSTSGLDGAYVVSGVNFNGTNTIIACSAETFTSAAVGGGSIVVQPCNRCVLISSAAVAVVLNKIKLFDGFKVVSSSFGTLSGIKTLGQVSIGGHLILTGFYSAFDFNIGSNNIVYKNTIKSCYYGYVNDSNAYVYYGAVAITVDGCTVAFFARANAYVFLVYATVVGRNNSIAYSPDVNAAGNGNAYIQTI